MNSTLEFIPYKYINASKKKDGKRRKYNNGYNQNSSLIDLHENGYAREQVQFLLDLMERNTCGCLLLFRRRRYNA